MGGGDVHTKRDAIVSVQAWWNLRANGLAP